MTREDLARRAGVTLQTIIALEAGRYKTLLALAFRITRMFGVGMEDVFRAHEAEVLPSRTSRNPS